MRLRLLLTCALLAAGSAPVFSAPLKDAKVSHALNDVRVVDHAAGTHPAAPQEIVRDGSAILTGPRSRAELTFPDRTLARLGAETSLRSQPGTRDLLLDRGTLLLQVPKLRGGARIHTGSLTSSVGSATILIEHLPGGSVKVVVLEGDLRISVDGFLGDSIVLTPGKMLITKPDVRRIPDPVDVDLRTLTKTSSLIEPANFQGASEVCVAPLPSRPLIERTIERQAGLVKRQELFPTNLVILGSGTTVVIPGAGAQPEPPAQIADRPPPGQARGAPATTATNRDGYAGMTN